MLSRTTGGTISSFFNRVIVSFDIRATGKIDGLRRIGEIDFFILELLVNGKIDSLLNIHITIVVGVQHVIDDLEFQGIVAETLGSAPDRTVSDQDRR